MSLPNYVFVQEKKDARGETYLDVSYTQGDTVEDDGTTQTVGTYKLIKKLKMKKSLEIFFKQRKSR